jgi:hypothetical protein
VDQVAAQVTDMLPTDKVAEQRGKDLTVVQQDHMDRHMAAAVVVVLEHRVCTEPLLHQLVLAGGADGLELMVQVLGMQVVGLVAPMAQQVEVQHMDKWVVQVAAAVQEVTTAAAAPLALDTILKDIIVNMADIVPQTDCLIQVAEAERADITAQIHTELVVEAAPEL